VNTTNTCERPGCSQDRPGHTDHMWTGSIPVRRVDVQPGTIHLYALTDEDREKFPDDEILLALCGEDVSQEHGSAKLTVAQAEGLIAKLQRAIDFTRQA